MMKNFIIKYRIRLLIIIVILTVFFALTLTSYAYYLWNSTINYNSEHVITNVSCFSLRSSGVSRLSNLNSVPMHDYDAIYDNKRASVTIQNNCDVDIYFTMFLVPTSSDYYVDKIRYAIYDDLNNRPNCGNSLYDEDNIVTFDQNTVKELVYDTSINETDVGVAYAVDYNFVYANNEKTFYVDLWIDYYEGGTINNNYANSTHTQYFKFRTAIKTDVDEYVIPSNCD